MNANLYFATWHHVLQELLGKKIGVFGECKTTSGAAKNYILHAQR